jgi:dTDP-4-dehydrorhamnose reductase
MLGHDVRAAAERAGHELIARARDQLDISDAAAVARSLERAAPDAVLNCAAWTDVDGAQEHRAQAFAVNADGAGTLARAAAAAGASMLHVSSDYVFDGRAPRARDGSPRPYLETDPTAPRSVYGESKLAGERLVLEASPAHVVVRSAWLFGTAGRNFAATMLALAAEQAERGVDPVVRVVSVQIGCPTWTGHLAPALIGLLERRVRGLVHLAGGGAISWSGFAREIFRQAEVECEVQELSSAEIARAAPRPPWSVLESAREDVLALPPWQDGLAGYLAARAGVVRA